MTVPFSVIPQQGVYVPLFYAEMDNSQANTSTTGAQPAVILGYADSLSSMPRNQLTPVTSVSELQKLAGRSSQLGRMVAAYRAVDSGGQLWAIAVPEPTGGVAATGEITVSGQVISAGVISLYIGSTRLQIPVAVGDTVDTIADNIYTAITSVDLPVTITVETLTGGVIPLTAVQKGLSGNEIPICVNYYGSAGGERLPSGVNIAIKPMSGGAGAPDLTAAMAALGDEECEFLVSPFNDSASLDAVGLAFNDTSGRWAPGRQTYGHVYSAKPGKLADLQTFGKGRNDQHVTLVGFEQETQTCADELAAAFTGRQAVFIRADPARPTQTGQLNGVLPAPVGKRFDKQQQNALLQSGIATTYAQGGNCFIQRAVTTYQKNPYGSHDNSYLDSETLHTSAYVLRTLETAITSKYGRHKLANDGTRFGPGAAVVTPNVIKGELCAQYQELEEAAIVENFEIFKKYLLVERSKQDSNRLNILFPPDYVNQLRVFALLNQFRLQYSEEA